MPKKIFELANELEMGAIALLERLKAEGLSFRNHMAELSDEEVKQVMDLLSPTATSSGATKATKSSKVKKKTDESGGAKKNLKTDSELGPVAKIVRKKPSQKSDFEKNKELKELEELREAVQKENALSAASSLDLEPIIETIELEAPENEQLGKEQEVLILEQNETLVGESSFLPEETSAHQEKVKKVEEEQKDEISLDSISMQESSVSKLATKDIHKDQKDKMNVKIIPSSGLRIVSRPPPAPILEEKKEESSSEKNRPTSVPGKKSSIEEIDEFLKPKMHRFTPVYIPPVKKVIESPPTSSVSAKSTLSKEQQTIIAEEENKKTQKKKLGDLASVVSKRPGVSRSQILTQTRAETELRSYSAVSSAKTLYPVTKKKKSYLGPTSQTSLVEMKENKRVISMYGAITGLELANKLKVKFKDLADAVLDINLLLEQEDYLGPILANEVASLYKYRIENREFDENTILNNPSELDREDQGSLLEKKQSNLPSRPPVVAIMGHVDHGKTTLLDYIRKAKVADGEAGGITQHIGAYEVVVEEKGSITFLDTPGHAAFAAMRQRGAHLTDIVILVVAADDGVMPQTKESIKFCQYAKVPIIVAINKIDKEGVKLDRIKSELSELGLTSEDWGGTVQMVPVSALKGQGIDDLLEAVLIEAELLDLRANTKNAAKGVVIESKIEQGRGPVATVLIQEGILSKGDSLVVGETSGRARSLTSFQGIDLKSAGPSIPVQILGLEGIPNPGDVLNVVKNEREAKKIADNRLQERRKLENTVARPKMTLQDFFANANMGETQKKELNLIIRADVQGSYEAIVHALESMGTAEVGIKILTGGVGAISDNDVLMASGAKGIVIGFNMRPVTSARKMAEEKGVEVKTYSIIYDLINDVKLALEGLLAPEVSEEFVGRAEVKDLFTNPKVGTIAGCLVVDGKMILGTHMRLLRQGRIIYTGKLSSLRRFKEDVKEVRTGLECGLSLDNFNDIKVGDIFEAFMLKEKRRELELGLEMR